MAFHRPGVYAYYFGRAHLGSISGFTATLMVAGTAKGLSAVPSPGDGYR